MVLKKDHCTSVQTLLVLTGENDWRRQYICRGLMIPFNVLDFSIHRVKDVVKGFRGTGIAQGSSQTDSSHWDALQLKSSMVELLRRDLMYITKTCRRNRSSLEAQ